MNAIKNRTVGRSFRINEQYIYALNEEAKREGVTLNAFVNKVLKEYAEYQRYFKRFGGVSIFQKSFSRIIEACPKEALREIARDAGEAIALDVFRAWGLELTYENAVHFLFFVLAEQANWFTYEHHVTKGKEIFHLRHNMCENWSIYTAEVLSTVFRVHFNKKVELESLSGSVTLKILMS